MNSPDTFSQRLKRLMLAHNHSAATLAVAIGTSRQKVSYYLTGEYEPKLDTLLALAKVLGGSLAMFDGVTTDGTPRCASAPRWFSPCASSGE